MSDLPPGKQAMLAEALDSFSKIYSHPATHFGYAPGRVELLGNHTDYNGGSVVCAALNLGVLAIGRRRDDHLVRVASNAFGDQPPVEIDLDSIRRDSSTAWADYVRGPLLMAKRAGLVMVGMDMYVTADLPVGAGLSSSAAIELATLNLLNAISEQPLDSMPAAKLCKKAENEFVGVPCGLMDQFASSHGVAGHALYLDCLTEEHGAMPLGSQTAIVVIDSQTHHALADGQYAQLREWCEQSARKINTAMGRGGDNEQLLRFVSPEELDAKQELLTKEEAPRARHIVLEQQRVVRGREALQAGDPATFGQLMVQSHASSRDLFGNSCQELDECIEIAEQVNQAAGDANGSWLGGKLSGGGFGGATVNLVRASQVDAFCEAFAVQFERTRGIKARIIHSEAGAGAVGGAIG